MIHDGETKSTSKFTMCSQRDPENRCNFDKSMARDTEGWSNSSYDLRARQHSWGTPEWSLKMLTIVSHVSLWPRRACWPSGLVASCGSVESPGPMFAEKLKLIEHICTYLPTSSVGAECRSQHTANLTSVRCRERQTCQETTAVVFREIFTSPHGCAACARKRKSARE